MTATDVDFVPVVSPADAAVVARLAAEIWYEHYVPIIGREQVDYMVPRFQSEAAVLAQVGTGLQYFLILKDGQQVLFGPRDAVFQKLLASQGSAAPKAPQP